MKVLNNDYSNKFIKTTKKSSGHKKGNISIQNIQNNSNISSSLPKLNKTLYKYVNEKLDSMKKLNNNNKNTLIVNQHNKSNSKKKHIFIYKKASLSPNLRGVKKSKEKNLKQKNIKEKIYNKKSISKNKILNQSVVDNNFNKNKSFTIITKRKENSKHSSIIKNSISTSAGLSISSNKIYESNRYIYSNNNSHSHDKKNNTNTTYNINNRNDQRFFIEERDYCNHKINNFNYETGSDDILNENMIFLKCDNYSTLTFGNSFSYSNSKRKNNEENINININNKNINITSFIDENNINDNNNNKNIYYYKLKEENESLKKELQVSTDQINILKKEIKKLKKNSRYYMKKTPKNNEPNLWDKKYLHKDLIKNKKIYNNNKINNISFYGLNGKIKIKKGILDKINNSVNINNVNKDKKKIKGIKINLNLKKITKKNEEEYYSCCILDKPCEQIKENISNLKIV